MTEVLQIKAVRPASDKVDKVEFHATHSWLACVTRGNTVAVWNYESNEVGTRQDTSYMFCSSCSSCCKRSPPRLSASLGYKEEA